MASHFMIDLETMSTAADAAILSIGIQEFDPRGEGIDESAGALIHVDLQACMNAGLRIDASTVMWWLSQSDDARAALVAREPLLLSEALVELVKFGQSHGGWAWANVWSNGAAFDIPILEMAFRRCRRDIPWEYNKVLDVRTMKWLAPDVPNVTPKVAHDALSDAQAQALYVQNCYRAIRGGMGAAAREEDMPQPPAAAIETIVEAGGEDKTEALAALWDRLRGLDWWHMMSDDPGVHRRGEAAVSEAKAAANGLGEAGKALYAAWEEHVKRGGPEVPRPGA